MPDTAILQRDDAANNLLRGLDRHDFERLADAARPVRLPRGHVLYEAEATIDTVWFPETGLISIISTMISGAMIETSVLGCEGGLGFIEAAGGGIIFSRAIVQIPGIFIAVPAKAYRAAFDASPAFRTVIANHIELLLAESRQAMACIGLHKVEQRLAWWLLEAQDRAGGMTELPLTQEFLSVMLGVRRPSVTLVALELQEEGLIQYTRGNITVLDRAGLERRSCECYATARRFRRIIEAGADS